MTDAVRAYVSVIRNPQNTHELQLGGVVTLKCENRQAINHQREMVARAVDQMTKRIIRIGGYGMLKVEYVDGKFVVNNYAYSTSGLPATQRKKITRAIESFQRCNIKQKDGTPIKNRLTITVIVG